ncbi:cell division protein FtsX [Candidatus Latescibacterota bacterium]
MYALREAIIGIWRTRNMTLVSVLTISVALLMLGFVGIITISANSIVNKVQKSEEINIYLNNEMTDGDMLILEETINSMREVEATRIISKEDAAKEFEAMFGNDLLSTLKENPLPRSIIITMADGYSTSNRMENLADKIREVENVESVEYGKELMSKLDIFFLIFIIIESIIIAVVLAACILVISNTISLTLIARKEAIEIMKLVGATDGFIRKPFYYEGLLQGLFSGLLTFLFLYGIYIWVQYAIPEISVYKYMFGINRFNNISFQHIIALIIPIGGFLGFLGSYLAVRRAF